MSTIADNYYYYSPGKRLVTIAAIVLHPSRAIFVQVFGSFWPRLALKSTTMYLAWSTHFWACSDMCFALHGSKLCLYAVLTELVLGNNVFFAPFSSFNYTIHIGCRFFWFCAQEIIFKAGYRLLGLYWFPLLPAGSDDMVKSNAATCKIDFETSSGASFVASFGDARCWAAQRGF